MLQFNVYRHEIIKKYARLSFLIEFELIRADMKHREAFSNNEIQLAKEKTEEAAGGQQRFECNVEELSMDDGCNHVFANQGKPLRGRY